MLLANKTDLEAAFKVAKDNNKDLAIELTVPERKATEVIIVKNDNLDYKLNYYRERYTDDLCLSGVRGIKMLQAKTIDFKLL